MREALDQCRENPECAADFYYKPAQHLSRYLRDHLHDIRFLESEGYRYLETEETEETNVDAVLNTIQSTYSEVLMVLERHLRSIESVRFVTRPDIATRYPHPALAGECLQSIVMEDPPGSGGHPWLNECLGLPPHDLFVDPHLSQSCSVQLRYCRSYVNFRIVYLALREDAKPYVPHSWEGVRSGLYIQDMNLAVPDREAGLTEASMLALLTIIAQEHHCELIAESVIGKDDAHQCVLEDTYRQNGFLFPAGDRQHAVKRLTAAETGGDKCYCGVREDGQDRVMINGRPLTMAFELADSSPTGFSWGYGGSGPFQLAVAITRDLYGAEGVWDKATGAGTPALRAIEGLIEKLPAEKEWTLTASQIRRYVDQFDTKMRRT